jgi:hypothetical protein
MRKTNTAMMFTQRRASEAVGKLIRNGMLATTAKAPKVRGAAQATWALASDSNVFWW